MKKKGREFLRVLVLALAAIMTMAGCASQGGADARNTGQSAADGNIIWAEGFDKMGTGQIATTDFEEIGFNYYPAQQNTATFNIQKQDGVSLLSMSKPADTPLGKASVFTLARQFPSPLTGKISFETIIRLRNLPPLADFEGTGNMSAERWIFVNDTVITNNSKPKGVGVCFKEGKILCGGAAKEFALQTWYTVNIIVDTDAGTYDVTINGEPLASGVPTTTAGIKQFGLYAYTNGSGIGIEDFQVTRR